MMKELTEKQIKENLVEGPFVSFALGELPGQLTNGKTYVPVRVIGFVHGDEEQIKIEDQKDFYIYKNLKLYDEVEPEYEPYGQYEFPEIELGEELITKEDEYSVSVIAIDKDKNNYEHVFCVFGKEARWINNEELFNYFTRKDGSVIGKVKDTTK